MIDLGAIPIKDKASMVLARGKIFSLAQDLKFNPITVTRIATMASELTRWVLTPGQGSHILIALENREGAPGLLLRFEAEKAMELVPALALERVFDQVEVDSLQSIKTFKFLPDPGFEPTDAFIEKERERVGRLTEEALLAQLQEAYDKLRMSSRLIQTEKMATAGTLVAGVAHEMNNPMTSLLQFTEYCLKHTAEDTRIHGVLKDMENQIKRCIDIVQNLLSFSRLEEEGEQGFQKESLSTVIDRVIKLISYRAEKERVSLRRNIAKDIPDIWMKPGQIQQVFLNLITNALDAVKESEKKEIRIEVRCEGTMVRAAIADSGCGMRPEDLNSVFDPFFTTKPVGQGTGLGLSISHGIIDSHSGKFSCTSRQGEGATFKILLPIEKRGGKAR
jgi:signal transduction histidine kinase